MANPTLLTQPFAANGDKNVIPNITAVQGAFSQDKGFPAECSLPLGAGGVAPSRQDMNGAFNMLSQIAFYAQKGYFWRWDAGQEYFVGCVVIDETDGNMYQCIQDVAAGGSVPSADATNWKKFSTGGGTKSLGDIVWRSIYNPQVVGEILANGAEVSRAMYPEYNALMAAQGYPWGDGDGATTFNLPNLIGRFAEGANIAGGYKEAGLPNISGTAKNAGDNKVFLIGSDGATGRMGATDGAITTVAVSNGVIYPSSGSQTMRYNLSIDASKSNPIYGNSTTVQPSSALLLPYVVVFTDSTPDSALVDMTQIAQDLAKKANRDLSNLTDTANDKLKAMAFPSNTKLNISLSTTTTTSAQTTVGIYTSPANGYVSFDGHANNTGYIYIQNTTNTILVSENGTTGTYLRLVLPVKKGDNINLIAGYVDTLSAMFIYAEGEV